MVSIRAKIRKTRNALQASTTDSDHQLSLSAEKIGSNDDILSEILLRLPVTSILQFKSVSKHWEWLLSQRRFTLRHDKRQISPGLFVNNKYIPYDIEDRSPPPFRSLNFCSDLNGIKIVQSCNGLLLCRSDRGHIRGRKYYVFNPTTKQFSIIPPVPGCADPRKTIRFMGLAFHQTTCPRYKVVCILSSDIKLRYSVKYLMVILIYSSDTREWKTNNCFCCSLDPDFRNGVYWNGAIYWTPFRFKSWYFDLNLEKLQDLTLPLSFWARTSPVYFGESRGHLYLIDILPDFNTSLIMYEMSADHSGWFKKYYVELHRYDPPCFHPYLILSYRASNCRFEVLDVVRGEEGDIFMVLKIWYRIVRYNLRDNSFKILFNMTYNQDDSFDRIYEEAHRYIQSLTPF